VVGNAEAGTSAHTHLEECVGFAVKSVPWPVEGGLWLLTMQETACVHMPFLPGNVDMRQRWDALVSESEDIG
jgi:hypothetical protein